MKSYKNKSFKEKVKLRILMLRATIILMFIYIIILAEMGFGDSRIITGLAQDVSNIIFLGGMIYILRKISYNKKLLQDKLLRLDEEIKEADERKKFLHDKSGGVVVDILLLTLLIITFTTALINMTAFYISFAILMITIILKATSYYLYMKLY